MITACRRENSNFIVILLLTRARQIDCNDTFSSNLVYTILINAFSVQNITDIVRILHAIYLCLSMDTLLTTVAVAIIVQSTHLKNFLNFPLEQWYTLEATPTPINELAYNLELRFFLHYTIIHKTTKMSFQPQEFKMLGEKYYLGACIPRAIKGIEVSTLATVSARCISPDKGMQQYINYLHEIRLFAGKQ